MAHAIKWLSNKAAGLLLLSNGYQIRQPACYYQMAPITYDVFSGEIMAVLTIVGVSLISYLFSALEEWSKTHAHSHHTYILFRASRELALLGLVSLILFALEQSNAIRNQTAENRLAYLHIAIFGIVLTFLCYTGVLLLSSHAISAEWQRLERYHSFDTYKALKLCLHEDQALLQLPKEMISTTLSHLPEPPPIRSLLMAFCKHPVTTVRYYRRLHVARFLEQRQRFLLCHAESLPPHFSFAAYLTVCLHHVYVRLVSIPDGLWLALAAAITTDLYLRIVWGWYAHAVSVVVLVVGLSIGIVLLAAADVWKMQVINWEILHSEYARMSVPLGGGHDSWNDVARSMTTLRGMRGLSGGTETQATAAAAVAAAAAAILPAIVVGAGPASLADVSPDSTVHKWATLKSTQGGGGPASVLRLPPTVAEVGVDFDIIRGVSLDARVMAEAQIHQQQLQQQLSQHTLRSIHSVHSTHGAASLRVGLPSIKEVASPVATPAMVVVEVPPSHPLPSHSAVDAAAGHEADTPATGELEEGGKSTTTRGALAGSPLQPPSRPGLPAAWMLPSRRQLRRPSQSSSGPAVVREEVRPRSLAESAPAAVPTPPPPHAPARSLNATRSSSNVLGSGRGSSSGDGDHSRVPSSAFDLSPVTVSPPSTANEGGGSSSRQQHVARHGALSPTGYATLHWRHVEQQRRLFWCGRPILVLRALQGERRVLMGGRAEGIVFRRAGVAQTISMYYTV